MNPTVSVNETINTIFSGRKVIGAGFLADFHGKV
jgi:hypothetical protein